MNKLVYPSLSVCAQNLPLLDLIPDTHAWVKDLNGRFVFANGLFLERFGFASVDGLIGKDDYSLSTESMAEHYREDDDLVLRGGVVTDRLELIGGEAADVEWFLTSKWPVYDQKDNILGSIGISRHLNRSERRSLPFRELGATIDYIAVNFSSNISIRNLAAASNLSVSALERRFRKHLGVTPYQYLLAVRLEHARQLLLKTNKSVGTVALETGFADHSHFTRSYRRKYDHSPRDARSVYEAEFSGKESPVPNR